MTTEDRPPQYRSYLLTAWEERSRDVSVPAVWRFGLEDVHNGKHRRIFATIEEVMWFVLNEIESLSNG